MLSNHLIPAEIGCVASGELNFAGICVPLLERPMAAFANRLATQTMRMAMVLQPWTCGLRASGGVPDRADAATGGV